MPGQKGRPVEYSELAIDEKHQIIASDLTEKSVADTSALDVLLDQVDAFDTFMADGAYDGDPVYTQILQQQPNTNIVIPPPKNAVPNASDQPIRNQYVDAINNQGRMAWQKQTNYGLRALVELAMLRYKPSSGQSWRPVSCLSKKQRQRSLCAC